MDQMRLTFQSKRYIKALAPKMEAKASPVSELTVAPVPTTAIQEIILDHKGPESIEPLIDLNELAEAIIEEKDDAPVAQAIQANQATFKCSSCDKVFSKRFNLNKHVKAVHSGAAKKYIKHIKKDKLFLCAICAKTFKKAYNLKLHYGRIHKREELLEHKIPLEPVMHYCRRVSKETEERKTLIHEYEQEKREAFPLLDENTKAMVLDHQFSIPMLKLLAYEGATQSPLSPLK